MILDSQETKTQYVKKLSLENFPEESRIKLQEYLCPLCQGIYVEPILDSCAHIFCKSCFQTYVESMNNRDNQNQIICPLGKSPLDLSKTKDFDFISDIIKRQSIYCLNKNKGCNWVGLFALFQNHLDNECNFQEIKCKNIGCEATYLKSQQAEHEANCEYKLIKCENCGNGILKKNIKNHPNECPKETIKCSCGNEFLRENIQSHKESECPEEYIPCKFASIGCTEKFQRKNYIPNLIEKNLEHNKQIINWIMTLKNKTNEDYEERKRELEQKRAEIENFYNYLTDICQKYDIPNDYMIE